MAPARFEIGRGRLSIWTGAFVALACVVILLLSVWREFQSREGDLHVAEVEVGNLARSLTQHADDTFELADRTLTVLVNQLELEGTGPSAIGKINTFFDRRARSERLRGIFVYDDTGKWLATTEKVGNLAALNNSDRDYFQRHRSSADRGTVLGRPVKSRSGGQWIITLSRRFNRADGSFGGVALVTIDVDYFSHFYKQFDVGPNGSISLMTADGILLARNPDDGTFTGRDMSNSSFFRNGRSNSQAGVYYFVSPLDGVERLSFYQASRGYPVIVLATRAKREVLTSWWHDSLLHMAVVIFLTFIIALFGTFLVQQLRNRQRMAAVIVAKEADFRLLAEQCSDVVMRIGLNERIVYVSPSCTRVLAGPRNKFSARLRLTAFTQRIAKRSHRRSLD